MYWEKLVGKSITDTYKHVEEIEQYVYEFKKLKYEMTSLELREIKETMSNLIAMVEELDMEVESLKTKLRYEKEDKEDNYRPISYASQVGWHHKW